MCLKVNDTDNISKLITKFSQHCPRRQNSSKLKEFADNDFDFDGNGRKFSKWVENIGGKEKLLIMSNFSFPLCFQKTCTADK